MLQPPHHHLAQFNIARIRYPLQWGSKIQEVLVLQALLLFCFMSHVAIKYKQLQWFTLSTNISLQHDCNMERTLVLAAIVDVRGFLVCRGVAAVW